MASRFYYAPIDPGYGAIGQAIGAGLAGATQSVVGAVEARRRREELERLRQEQIARENEAERNRYSVMGYTPRTREVVEQAPSLATPGGVITGPGPIPGPEPIAPTGPGISIRNAVGAMGFGPAPAEAARPLSIPAALGGGQVAPAPVAPASGTGLTIPAALQGPGPQFMTPDATGPVISVGGVEMEYAPGRSQAILEARQQRHELAAEKRAAEEEFRTRFAAALEEGVRDLSDDGVITPGTRALLDSVGLKEQDIESDPTGEKAWERLHKRWLKQYEYEQAGRVEIARINAAGRDNELTANQAARQAADDIAGWIQRYSGQGLTAPQILALLRPRAGEIGGEGALSGAINNVLLGRRQLKVQQNMEPAQLTVMSRKNGPKFGTPEFNDAVLREAERLADLSMRKPDNIWETEPVPVETPAVETPAPAAPAGPIGDARGTAAPAPVAPAPASAAPVVAPTAPAAIQDTAIRDTIQRGEEAKAELATLGSIDSATLSAPQRRRVQNLQDTVARGEQARIQLGSIGNSLVGPGFGLAGSDLRSQQQRDWDEAYAAALASGRDPSVLGPRPR